MTAKKILFLLFTSIFIISCDSKKGKTNIFDLSPVDTLYYHEKIYIGEDGFSRPRKSFKSKSQTKKGLPKNEEILMSLVYEGDYKELVKHTTIDIQPETKKLRITKINDYNYKLFIDSSFSERIISMSYILGPKKNYVLKTYFRDEVIKFPEKLHISQFNQLVEED